MPKPEARSDSLQTAGPNTHRIPSWLPLLVLVIFGFGLRLFVIARSEVAARDSVGFVRYALRLEREPFFDVIRTADQPPGYALAVMLVSWPVRAWTGELSCDTMIFSAQLASALLAALSIPFMFLFGREICDRQIGWIAAAVFLTLPAWVRLTSDGLSEGTYLFSLAVTLWLGARALRQPTVLRLFWCGLAAGNAYLVRPEGVELAAVIGAVLLARQLAPVWRQPWTRVGPQFAGIACGTILLLGPYVGTIGRLTNKNTGKIMLGDPEVNRDALPWVAAPAVGTPMAMWWYEPTDHGKSRELWGVRAIVLETLQALHYVVGILAIVGLFCFRSRPPGTLGTWLLAGLVIGHLALVWRMTVSIGYFSERHTLLFAFAACFPAAAALLWVGQRLGRFVRPGSFPGSALVTGVMLAGLLISAVPTLIRPLHANRAGHRAAGRWLAAHSTKADEIMDPFNWAEFYSGRLDGNTQPGSDRMFVVLEQSDNQHSRLPVIPNAKIAASKGQMVYHWPESKPEGQAQVAVYEVSKRRLRGE